MILVVACLTFAIRLGGVLMGQRLPRQGAWARGLNALPGCLIAALVAVLLLGAGPQEWIAGALAGVTALVSRNLLATMFVGVLAIYLLRTFA